MKSSIFITTSIAIGLGGCSAAQIEAQRLLDEGQATLQDIQANTSEKGWTVRCVVDQFKATRRCYAGTFGSRAGVSGIPFQLYFVDKSGPYIMAGFNTFPGRQATVRVDDKSVHPTSNVKAIVSDLRSGRIAYVVYHAWPQGEERMTVNVEGFDQAYKELLRRLSS